MTVAIYSKPLYCYYLSNEIILMVITLLFTSAKIKFTNNHVKNCNTVGLVIGSYSLSGRTRYRVVLVIGSYSLSGRTRYRVVPIVGPSSGHILGEKRPDNKTVL